MSGGYTPGLPLKGGGEGKERKGQGRAAPQFTFVATPLTVEMMASVIIGEVQQILPTAVFLFSFPTDSPDCLPILPIISGFFFTFWYFCFPLLVVGSVR